MSRSALAKIGSTRSSGKICFTWVLAPGTTPRRGDGRGLHDRAGAGPLVDSLPLVLVLLWSDHSAWGPRLEFLACVQHMGAARELATEAGAPAPDKRDRLERKNVLFALATERPGVLLWRPSAQIRGDEATSPDPAWRQGAKEARAFRQADADRYDAIQDAARKRRTHHR